MAVLEHKKQKNCRHHHHHHHHDRKSTSSYNKLFGLFSTTIRVWFWWVIVLLLIGSISYSISFFYDNTGTIFYSDYSTLSTVDFSFLLDRLPPPPPTGHDSYQEGRRRQEEEEDDDEPPQTATTTTRSMERQCPNPEYNSTPLSSLGDDACSSQHDHSESSSLSSSSSCHHHGICHSSPALIRHLQELADEIAAHSRVHCKDRLVVFGAAFGAKYLNLIWERRWTAEQTTQERLFQQYQKIQNKYNNNNNNSSSANNNNNNKNNNTTTTTYQRQSTCQFLFALDETLQSLPTRRRGRQQEQETSQSIPLNQTNTSSSSTTTTTSQEEYEFWFGKPSNNNNNEMVGVMPDFTVLRTAGQHVVGVRRDDLPYLNHRRNIKLFKFHPHILFPWAERIVWADAKLHWQSYARGKNGVQAYYHRTVEEPNVCGSVVSLPLHKATMGRTALKGIRKQTNNKTTTTTNGTDSGDDVAAANDDNNVVEWLTPPLSTVRFGRHCVAIRDAFRYRPQVSDSLQSVQTQCDYYLRHLSQTQEVIDTGKEMDNHHYNNHKKKKKKNKKKKKINEYSKKKNINDLGDWILPALDSTLIDSAVLAWDFRKDHCRQFVTNLLCNWMNEIQCFSDRDQLSFGYSLYEELMRLQQQQQREEEEEEQQQQQPYEQLPRKVQQQQETRKVQQKMKKNVVIHRRLGSLSMMNVSTMSSRKLSGLSSSSSSFRPRLELVWQDASSLNTTTFSFSSSSSSSSTTLQEFLFPENSNRILMDGVTTTTQSPLLYFVKSTCHWYNGRKALFHCDLNHSSTTT